MPTADAYADVAVVPRIALAFPLELPLPEGFEPARAETWPKVCGRLEYVEGRLLFMPPCGDEQQATVVDVVTEIGLWLREHEEFVGGTNEAGILLGNDVRGADAAIWRRSDRDPWTGGYVRVPPLLAIEVTGKEESIDALLTKARWYLDRGAEVVWVLDVAARSVHVITGTGTTLVERGGQLPAHPALPGLGPRVDDLFHQISR